MIRLVLKMMVRNKPIEQVLNQICPRWIHVERRRFNVARVESTRISAVVGHFPDPVGLRILFLQSRGWSRLSRPDYSTRVQVFQDGL